ncbi:hypothetical protein GCM10022247_58930 [Allokutzneria multivorans]|uniref:Uncharacterized protein n=1 Tax=Allokutzneria multivorans TaxID=1142134 RepID=A0ABP7TH68_9PSEU
MTAAEISDSAAHTSSHSSSDSSGTLGSSDVLIRANVRRPGSLMRATLATPVTSFARPEENR